MTTKLIAASADQESAAGQADHLFPSLIDRLVGLRDSVSSFEDSGPAGSGWKSGVLIDQIAALDEAIRTLRSQRAETEDLRTGYEAARLEIESLRGKGWQPIETAPKDGTLILATIYIHCSDGTAAWQRHAIYFDAERNITYTDGGDETVWDFDDYQYWMPLPAAPAEGESQ